MKFNWGNGIALVYGTFVAVMIGFVFLSRQYDPGLVSPDYYNLDLNYQEYMQKKQNAVNLPKRLDVHYDAVRQVIQIQFPSGNSLPAGSIKCFRPVNVRDDINLEIKTDPEGQMEIPAVQMPNGLWHVEVDWQTDGTKYFDEATLTITHA